MRVTFQAVIFRATGVVAFSFGIKYIGLTDVLKSLFVKLAIRLCIGGLPVSALLTTKQANEIGVLELTCYTGRQDYLESGDFCDPDIETKHRGIYIGVVYCYADEDNPGWTFFIDYPQRIFSSNNIYATDTSALAAGTIAVDKLLEIIF